MSLAIENSPHAPSGAERNVEAAQPVREAIAIGVAALAATRVHVRGTSLAISLRAP